MTCPDINDIIDFSASDEPNAAMEAHLLTCPECQEQLHLLRTLERHFAPEEPLSEELVQRIMDALPEPEAEGEPEGVWAPESAGTPKAAGPDPDGRVPVIQVLGSGVLGWLTAALAMFFSLPEGTTSFTLILILATVVAVGAGVAQVKMGNDAGRPALTAP